MNDLIISHIDTHILQRLENYAGNPSELHTALGNYIASMGIAPAEHTVAVFEYLLHNRSPQTSEEIFQALYPTESSLTRTSVDTSLEILAQTGIIQVVRMDTETYTAKRHNKEAVPHAHLICSCCGAVEEIPMSANVARMVALPRGATVNDMQMMCLGLCAKCSKTQQVN